MGRVHRSRWASGRRCSGPISSRRRPSNSSPVPPSVRSGDTIRPRISADGCVVVAITEIAFDLFRDDDRDDRWDVYRLLVPECGGQPNGWELISLSQRTVARRWTACSPRRPGADRLGLPDRVRAPGDRVTRGCRHDHDRRHHGAGQRSGSRDHGRRDTAEAPNGAYLYRGFSQPVLSQNGRHLAFVADATASEALPGWADGPVPGEYATTQVYVWDRFADDQRRGVRLVSGRDGVAVDRRGDLTGDVRGRSRHRVHVT